MRLSSRSVRTVVGGEHGASVGDLEAHRGRHRNQASAPAWSTNSGAAALGAAGELLDRRGDAFDDVYELVALRGRVGPSVADLAGGGDYRVPPKTGNTLASP